MASFEGIAAGLFLAAGVALIVRFCYRLLRWARSGKGSAHALGAVLTEVTQVPAVQEAKRGKKVREDGGGDPPREE